MNSIETKNEIELIMDSKFMLLFVPSFKVLFSKKNPENNNQFRVFNANLLTRNKVYVWQFKQNTFQNINFEEQAIPQIKKTIPSPSLVCIPSKPALFLPQIQLGNPKKATETKCDLTPLEAIKLNENPIDLSIPKNLNICQTHLMQQIQLCQVLNK